MVMFRCDFETARLLARNLPLDETELARLGFHRFAAFSQGFDRVSGIGKTRHIEIPSRWKDVAKKSLDKYGKEIPIESYSFASKKGSIIPKITPLEYFLLNTLYLEKRDINHGELIAAGIAKFGVDERAVNAALIDSLLQHRQFVVRNTDYQDGKNQYDTSASFSITKLAIQSIYSRAYAGPGAGGELHTGVISAIAEKNTEQYHYCIPDLADTSGKRADLLVYEFQGADGKDVTQHGKINPVMWSESVTAVEVETDPTKHKGQIITNYKKNVSRGMRVWFVIFSQKHKEYVIDALAEENIGKESYDIVLVDPRTIDEKNSTYRDASESVDDMQDEVIKGIGTGYSTLGDIVNKSNLTASQVMACLESLEKKGKVERSGAIKTVTKHSLRMTGTKKTQTKKDTFAVNPDLTQKAVPESVGGTDVTDKNITTGPAGKYANSEVAALKLFLEDDDFEGHDAVCAELTSRGYGVRRKKNGGVTIYRLG